MDDPQAFDPFINDLLHTGQGAAVGTIALNLSQMAPLHPQVASLFAFLGWS